MPATSAGMTAGRRFDRSGADGGATPTIAAPNFLDRANFHEYNFANISEQRPGGWKCIEYI
jgi:hypothetical protein